MPWPQLPDGGNDFNWFGVLIILCVSAWGGLVNYLSRLKSGVIKRFQILDLVLELAISMFSGLVVGCIAISLDISPYLTMALAGMAGHAGCRTVYFLNRAYEQKIKQLLKKINF